MDCSYPIRNVVTDRRQSSQNVVLVLMRVENFDLVSAEVIAQLLHDRQWIALTLQDDVCPDAGALQIMGEPSSVEENGRNLQVLMPRQ